VNERLPQVALTGIGLITPIGNDRETVSLNLREGNHGFSPVEFWGNPNLPVRWAGLVRGFQVESPSYWDWSWPETYTIPRETLRSLAPHGVYAMCAAQQAIQDAGLQNADFAEDPGTGLFCASAGSAMLLHHNLGQMRAAQGERGNPMGLVSSIAGTLNFTLASYFRITGAVCGFVSACASSSHALGYACDEIRRGRLKRVLVVGAEDVNAESLLPFHAMRTLSLAAEAREASRPFDGARDGFVGAGGAVAVILEESNLARARGCQSYVEVAGWGQAADGHGVASPHPEGKGLLLAMERALADAGERADSVDYVNAHATSTAQGDRAEALALRRILGEHRIPISSTKGLTGHPLSMAGVLEVALSALAVRRGFVPGNPHLVNVDPVCEGLFLPRETLFQSPRVVLSNSSGFGGSSVSVVLRASGD
jgi:3-oxoacyl-[acyl-carrier-protein] synthase-1